LEGIRLPRHPRSFSDNAPLFAALNGNINPPLSEQPFAAVSEAEARDTA
jgi:hypothetical protein